MLFPTSGIWKLAVYFDEELFDELVINVQDFWIDSNYLDFCEGNLMKKTIIYPSIAILIVVLVFSFFYNGFSGIQSITIQQYDEPINDGKITTDKEK